jgi:hypothetical protein
MWKCLAVGLICVPAVAAAEFVALDRTAMRQVLTDQKIAYPNATQTFYASGRTLYDAGRPSWGYWRIADDQYCSQWPPSDLWACYEMARDSETIRFIAKDGSVTDGVLLP